MFYVRELYSIKGNILKMICEYSEANNLIFMNLLKKLNSESRFRS